MLNFRIIYKDGYILYLSANGKYTIWAFIDALYSNEWQHNHVKYIEVKNLIYLVL